MKPEELTVLSKLMVHLLRLDRDVRLMLTELEGIAEEIYTIGIRLQGSDESYGREERLDLENSG